MERFRQLGVIEKAHVNGVWALAATGKSNREAIGDFVTGGADGKLKTWRFRSDQETTEENADEDSNSPKQSDPCAQLNAFSGHMLPIVAVAVAKDGTTAASTSLDGTVKIWNLASEEGDRKSINQLNVGETWGIAISADGQRVVTGGANGVVQIVDTAISAVDQTFSIGQSQSDSKDAARRENPMVMSVALSADDSQVALGAHDGSVTVLNVETGKPIGVKFPKHGGPVRSVAFLPAERNTVITGSDDQLVNFYDTISGNLTGSCRGHMGLVLSANGSDNGNYVVSGGSDQSVVVWDRMMKEPVYTYKGHTDSVWGVSYALDGKRIVSVADDGCISVLDCSNADVVQ